MAIPSAEERSHLIESHIEAGRSFVGGLPIDRASVCDSRSTVCERLARGVTGIRLLVVLAHPDDEVLAVGGRLEALADSRFLCVTDGVPLDGMDARAHGFRGLDGYREARRVELAKALGGLSGSRSLGISDQRAAWNLASLTRRVAAEVEAFRPEAVLTHPYEGGHPDHDACAFAVAQCGASAPVIEAPFYHAVPDGIETGVFLGDPGLVVELTEEQRAKKRERLACFRSQAETLRLFGVDVEAYRLAPAYDFLRRPHEGRLYYEGFDWGMTGDRFCELAAMAKRELER